MKSMVSIVCTALATVATCASAAAPQSAPIRDKALMLYFAKSFGSTQRQNRTPLQFGLKLQQSSTFVPGVSVGLVDLRLAADGRKSLSVADVPMFDSASSATSSGEDSWTHRYTVTVIAVGAVAVIACLAHKIICEKKSGIEDYTIPPVTPPPGGPG